MLPAQPRVLTDLARLANRVAEQGGTARVVAVQVTDPVAEAGLIDELNAARDAEYTELLERLPAFHTELEQETARGRATYAEVEESEADLHRYQAWLGQDHRPRLLPRHRRCDRPGGGADRRDRPGCVRAGRAHCGEPRRYRRHHHGANPGHRCAMQLRAAGIDPLAWTPRCCGLRVRQQG